MADPRASDPGEITAAGDVWGWPLLDVLPTPCLVVDTTTCRVIRGNAAARVADLQPATGSAAYVLLPPHGRADAAELARYLVACAGAAEGIEITWHTPDRPLTFRAFCRRLPNLDGQPALALLTFLDISRQKAAEEELRQALEARDEFFSVATHELKDPLFSLQLSIQLLRRSALKLGEIPAHVLQHLEVSERQAARLARLVENLLDVARIVNHRVRLDAEAVDLCALARETIARFQARADEAGTPLAIETCDPLIGYFDRLKLEQVLGNLLANALKYGAAQPVAVRVRGEGETAFLEVEDRGVGIAPEDQERIFHRFERASQGYRKESLGLGLYIVRSLVEAHGGTVRLRSTLGQGSTFTVELPRLRLSPAERPHGGQEAAAGG